MTHQEYIIVVLNSFILFQFTSLDPNREQRHARSSKLSAVQPHSLWNFWRKTAFCGHEKKTVVRFFTTLLFSSTKKIKCFYT